MDRAALAERMIGESPSFLQMQEHLSRLAPLNKPVLIIGERGTGKELVASRIHYLSQRWDNPFLKINCASFNEALLESQLFGHEAGAFTGASKQQKGFFERADQGTLFLDELATTSMAVQERILRITEYGEVERLGGNKSINVDVRLVAATNVDLPELAEEGKFREDLLDRLAFDVITLPPLRERIEDIPVLAQHFAIQMIKELEREFFPGFSKTAAKALLEYQWPGNIRELKNVIERAIYQSEDPEQPIKEIVFDPFESPYRPKSKNTSNQNMPKAGEKNLKEQVQDFEVAMIQDALKQCQFNQRKTADLLGLSYDQLRGYLRKYDKMLSASDD
jgi:psp operon transcriptional activator